MRWCVLEVANGELFTLSGIPNFPISFEYKNESLASTDNESGYRATNSIIATEPELSISSELIPQARLMVFRVENQAIVVIDGQNAAGEGSEETGMTWHFAMEERSVRDLEAALRAM